MGVVHQSTQFDSGYINNTEPVLSDIPKCIQQKYRHEIPMYPESNCVGALLI